MHMKAIRSFIEERHVIIVSVFFAVFLCIGLIIFKDYGISWDEPLLFERNKAILNDIFEGKEVSIPSYMGRYHGSAFEIALIFIEKALGMSGDIRTTYLLRHLVIFLFFYIGVIFFYKMCEYIFRDWKIGLLGSIFLILNPRTFADSFYNSKDIPCMVFFIVSMYTLMKYLDKKTISRAFIHGLASAFLIDIRIAGILVPFFTITFLAIDTLTTHKESIKKNTGSGVIYIASLITFTWIFWPVLWRRPIYHFIHALTQMSHYPHIHYSLFYLGKCIKPVDVPWHYLPVWLMISIPLFYIFCFFVGCATSLRLLIREKVQFYFGKRNDLICILWFFLPVILVIMTKATLYNGWRQVFFIYPPFVVLSLIGLIRISGFFKMKLHGLRYRIVNAFWVVIIIVSIMQTAYFMVRNHPYQNIYFNILAGKDDNFELDYWGVSYRKALEYILKNDTSGSIKIYVVDMPGRWNAYILPDNDRERLVYVNNIEEAKYFLTNYPRTKSLVRGKEECYSINVDGREIMAVYRL